MKEKHPFKYIKEFTAVQALVIGYAIITLIGAILLSLPFSSADGRMQPFVDSLFVAASGISTSGLTVVDIGTYYSLAGQVILLVIFQVGGIGYMSIFICFISFFRIKTSIRMNSMANESVAGAESIVFGNFFRFIIFFTILVELTGGIMLAVEWSKEFPLLKALYLGMFHSVSAFCTAGFSVFSDSLIRYRTSIPVNVIINIISLLGGIGFIVVYDLLDYLKKKFLSGEYRKLTVHSKIILTSTTFFILIFTLVVLFSEKWTPGMNPADKIMSSLFQTISASTTDGFNTIDIGLMSQRSLIVLMILMFTGAAPGSTGGGIKISTLTLIIFYLFHQLKTRNEKVNLFKRQLPIETVHKAFSVFTWFIIIIMIDFGVLCTTEKAGYLPLLFEIVSAIGNTGLSMGITSGLSILARIMLTITMFIGRVGPLALGLALMGKIKYLPFEYPREDILVI